MNWNKDIDFRALRERLARYSRKRVLGLDLGTDSLRIVEIVQKGQELHIENLFNIPTGSKMIKNGELVNLEHLTEELQKLFRDYKLKTRRVVAAVHNRNITQKFTRIPMLVGRDLPNYVEVEYSKHLADARNLLTVLDYQNFGELSLGEGANYSVLLSAMPKALSLQLVSALEKSRLRLTAVDTWLTALFRAGSLDLLPTDSNRLVLNFGRDALDIVFIKGQVPVYTRSLPNAGGAALIRQLNESLGISYELADRLRREVGLAAPSTHARPEFQQVDDNRYLDVLRRVLSEIAKEINESLEYFTREMREPCPYVLLSGSFTAFPGFFDYLEAQIDAELHLFVLEYKQEFLGYSLVNATEQDVTAEYALALGLALREFDPRSSKRLNLTSQEYRRTKLKSQVVKTSAGVLVGALAAHLLLQGGLLYFQHRLDRLQVQQQQQERKQAQLKQLQAEIAGEQQVQASLTQVKFPLYTFLIYLNQQIPQALNLTQIYSDANTSQSSAPNVSSLDVSQQSGAASTPVARASASATVPGTGSTSATPPAGAPSTSDTSDTPAPSVAAAVPTVRHVILEGTTSSALAVGSLVQSLNTLPYFSSVALSQLTTQELPSPSPSGKASGNSQTLNPTTAAVSTDTLHFRLICTIGGNPTYAEEATR